MKTPAQSPLPAAVEQLATARAAARAHAHRPPACDECREYRSAVRDAEEQARRSIGGAR